MAKMTVKGLDAYMAKLSALEQSTDRVVREVIHDGAEIVADAIREGLELSLIHISEPTRRSG